MYPHFTSIVEVVKSKSFQNLQNRGGDEQGNYSLRRPPKLIIPQIFIEQRWATVYKFMCKQICISNKANMTRAIMRVQFWVNGQYSPRTEPTEQPIFTQN